MSLILLFDDRDDQREQLRRGLEKECGGEVEIKPFESDSVVEGGASFERHIASWVDEHCGGEDIALIVCDKELGLYRNLSGLSATAVSEVALQMGLPFCQYSQQACEDEREFERFKGLQRWSSDEITLEGLGPNVWAPMAASLFRGFDAIKNSYEQLSDTSGTPALALATILEKPQTESRIALYGSGGQGFLNEILTFYDSANPDMEMLYKRMPRVLGNWLFLSILRFPGILVNETAAASYLNIDCDAFKRDDVQEQFEGVRYTGPFHELELGPWWWRAELDVLLAEAECKDGLEYVGKKGIEVSECLDPHSGERAGYYCMLTRKPVSAENSRGGISWFPSGADLARIRKDKFEQITALVGMY